MKAYLYDPLGATTREVKARYRGACRGCGAPTSPRGGKGDAYAYCKSCRPGRSRGNGPASGSVRRSAPGERATALRRPPTTGRAPTHADAASTRSNDYKPENGPRRPPSSMCTGAGPRPSPTPSAALERSGFNVGDIRMRGSRLRVCERERRTSPRHFRQSSRATATRGPRSLPLRPDRLQQPWKQRRGRDPLSWRSSVLVGAARDAAALAQARQSARGSTSSLQSPGQAEWSPR